MGLPAWTGDAQSTPQMSIKWLSFKVPFLERTIPATTNKRTNCSPGASMIQWSVPRPIRLTQGIEGAQNQIQGRMSCVSWRMLKEIEAARLPSSAVKAMDTGSMSLGLHDATPTHSSLFPIPIV